jgi:hypothetical protein
MAVVSAVRAVISFLATLVFDMNVVGTLCGPLVGLWASTIMSLPGSLLARVSDSVKNVKVSALQLLAVGADYDLMEDT